MVLQRFYGCLFWSSKEKKYRGCTTDTLHKEPDLNQQEFYFVLAEELIENTTSSTSTKTSSFCV